MDGHRPPFHRYKSCRITKCATTVIHASIFTFMPSHCIPTHLVTTGFAFNLGVIVCIDFIPINHIVCLPFAKYGFMVQLVIHFMSLPTLDASFVSLFQSIVTKIIYDVFRIIYIFTVTAATLDVFIDCILDILR